MDLYEEKSKVDRGEIDSKDSFQTNVRTKLFIFLWGKNIVKDYPSRNSTKFGFIWFNDL
jgi:hypothetical protein